MGIRTIVTVLFLTFGLERPGFAETVPETGTVTPAAADATGGNGNNGTVLAQAMSKEDAAQLRRDLNALAQSMQVVDGSAPLTAPVANGTNPNATPPQPAVPAYAPAVVDSQKNMADVADKALSMVNGLVISVSQSMEKVAPEIWRVMIRQQYAKAAGELIVPFGLFAGSLVYWFSMRPARKSATMKKEANEKMGSRAPMEDTVVGLWYYSTAWAFPMVSVSIGGVWTLVRLSDAIKYLINPEFYAVRDLILLLVNPGSLN